MIGKKKVADCYPELVKFFKNAEDAKNVSIRSDKRIEVKCPDCGHEHVMIVKNLTRRHYNCPVCGNKGSFGERLLLSIFDEQNINYQYQLNKKIFEWCNCYKYDFYLNDYNVIIEVNGSQHSTTSFGYKNSRTISEEQKNDSLKKELALQNGVKEVIYINYADRDIKIFKKEIIEKLKDFIDTNSINWTKCVGKACNSKLIESIKLWKEFKETKTTKEISSILNISSSTLVKYLHTGNDLGFCTYDSKEERLKQNRKNAQKIRDTRTKKINVYTKDNVFLGTYNGARYLCEHSKELFNTDFRYTDIIAVCNNRQKTHRDLKFIYYDNDKRNRDK